MEKVLMQSSRGSKAEVPVGGTHPSIEEWCRRGWTPVASGSAPRVQDATEPGLLPISGTPPIPPPVVPAAGQDDVAPAT